jgi:hypothetical protein
MIAIGAAGFGQAPKLTPLGTRIDGWPVEPEHMELLAALRPGDRATLLTAHGQEQSGRVVMKFATHAVLNLGGKHGKPGVVDARNIVRIKLAKR